MTSTSAMAAALKSRMAQALEADVRRRICQVLAGEHLCLTRANGTFCSRCDSCATAALAAVDQFCTNNVREVPA